MAKQFKSKEELLIELEELKLENQVLRTNLNKNIPENKEQFKHLVDTAPVLIWTSGTDTLCNYFNIPWLDFTGRTIEQEMGNGWTEGVHPDDLQHCLDIYLNSFNKHLKFKMEYRLRRADGEYRWILDNGVPRFSPDGAFIGYIGSCLDITERKHTEEALQVSELKYHSLFDNMEEGFSLGCLIIEHWLLMTLQTQKQFLFIQTLQTDNIILTSISIVEK